MSIQISRVLHAGYLFECKGTKIIFDPIFENPFSRNCYAYPDIEFDYQKIKLLKFDAIFISHFHDDHFSLESLNYLDRRTPLYIYTVHEEFVLLANRLGFSRVVRLRVDSPVFINSFEVIPRAAIDKDIDTIFQIKAQELNLLNVVDACIDPAGLDMLQAYAPWDMVLWPFQLMQETEVISPSRANFSNSDLPIEWIEQIKILNPRYLVPSSCQFIHESWSWYRHSFFPISYKNFQEQMNNYFPNMSVVRMNPGTSVIIDRHSLSPAPSLSWVRPVGDQNVDYNYRPDIKPPLTCEIAKNFEPLNAHQQNLVYKYCQEELLTTYISIGPPSEVYFNKSRLWKLSIYDHEGKAENFFYKLCGDSIQLIDQVDSKLSWLTEVPIAKIFAALFGGEMLTSMYLRVNDMTFDSEIEKEMEAVDILQDPLIRCLFARNSISAYQQAQLVKIKNYSFDD